jgi:hypothetical protein
MQNEFLQQKLVQLDKDLQEIKKATWAQELLMKSISLMDQQVPRSKGFEDQTKNSKNNGEEQVHLPTQTPAVTNTKKDRRASCLHQN